MLSTNTVMVYLITITINNQIAQIISVSEYKFVIDEYSDYITENETVSDFANDIQKQLC